MSSAISSVGGGISPQVVSGASMRMPPSQKMSQLFDKIDTSGSGSITQSQFEAAFQTMNPPAGIKSMGADAVFSQLDPNGTGKVSKQDFINGMKNVMEQARAQRHNGSHGASGTNASQTLSSALNSLQSTFKTTA